MSIIELLNRLAQTAPDVCKCRQESDGQVFSIGEYDFFYSASLCALHKTGTAMDRPALAWLRDAVEAAIEARGWEWEIGARKRADPMYPPTGRIDKAANIWPFESIMRFVSSEWEPTSTEALLAAFVAAVESEER